MCVLPFFIHFLNSFFVSSLYYVIFGIKSWIFESETQDFLISFLCVFTEKSSGHTPEAGLSAPKTANHTEDYEYEPPPDFIPPPPPERTSFWDFVYIAN